MQNVVLIIHLLLAISLIGLVLLQRSEGGGLGMGGGGAGGGAMSGRAAASALTKLTWGLAIAFICTSLALTILQVQKSSGSSVLDQLMPARSKKHRLMRMRSCRLRKKIPRRSCRSLSDPHLNMAAVANLAALS